MPDSSAATAIAKMGAFSSSSRLSAMSLLRSYRLAAGLRHEVGTRVLLRFELVIPLERLAGRVIEMRRHRHLHRREKVPGALVGLDAATLHAQHSAGRRAGGDAKLHGIP